MSVQVTEDLVNRVTTQVTKDYVALFAVYPIAVQAYENYGARTPFTVGAMMEQIQPGAQPADLEDVQRLLTLYSYATGKPIVESLVCLDAVFGEMILIGRAIGAIK